MGRLHPSEAVGQPLLHVGDKVLVAGAVYRVGLVNLCRARLDLAPGGKTTVREFDANGKHVTFEAPEGRRHLDVSPSAFVEHLK